MHIQILYHIVPSLLISSQQRRQWLAPHSWKIQSIMFKFSSAPAQVPTRCSMIYVLVLICLCYRYFCVWSPRHILLQVEYPKSSLSYIPASFELFLAVALWTDVSASIKTQPRLQDNTTVTLILHSSAISHSYRSPVVDCNIALLIPTVM